LVFPRPGADYVAPGKNRPPGRSLALVTIAAPSYFKGYLAKGETEENGANADLEH
jgi:hypothetical protein